MQKQDKEIHFSPNQMQTNRQEEEQMLTGSEQQQIDQEEATFQLDKTPQCIMDPHQYLNYCLHNKKIKIMNQQNVIYPNVYLKDISLHFKGPMEDKAYSRNYLYYINIRRGNTLCQIYHPKNTNQSQYDLFFCRRGMKKFYDLQKQYLATEWEQKLTSQHLKYRRRIFQKIDPIKHNKQTKIHLYSIFKQNGQHCQITYVKQLSTWLFASKNVSILVKNEDDLENYYQKIRFYWAKLIAKEFLKMLKQMNQTQINELKEQLNTKTLLGQHCGYEEHQHITKYDKVQIIFYAIVQKVGQDHCMPVDYCRDFLKKYNFKMSTIKEVRNLTDKNSIYQNMYNLLKQTAQGTMHQYGEGSVLYVVQQKNNIQRTISMSKLKTCEYLIFRRLRQMLKLSVQRKSTANNFEKFKFDIQCLIKHYFKPPKQLSFYLKVGKQAFSEAQKDANVTETYLRYKFVQFMQKIETNQKLKLQQQVQTGKINKNVLVICLPRFTTKLQKYAKVNCLPFDYMYRNIPNKNKQTQTTPNFYILHMIPRLPLQQKQLQNLEIFIYDYSQKDLIQIQNQLSQCKDLTKSHLITFIKSQDKNKSLSMLNDKIKSFRESLTLKSIKFTLVPASIQQKDQFVLKRLDQIKKQNIKAQKLKQNGQSNIPSQPETIQIKKPLIIVYPMLLPGSGKSTLCKQLQRIFANKNITFHKIEGDQIRRKYMQEKLKQQKKQFDNQTQQQNQIYYQAKDDTVKEYRQQLDKIINNHNQQSINNDQTRQSSKINQEILFIDKIFGPETIQNQIKAITKHKNIIPVVLYPKSGQLKLKNHTFPFTLEYLLICLKRCLQRTEHSTMTRRPQQICRTFIWFLSLYNNMSIKKLQNNLSQYSPYLQFVRIQTLQQKSMPLHSNLKKKVQECLLSNQNRNKMVQLIQEMYKNNEDYLKDSYAIENRTTAAQNIYQQLIKILSKH